MSRMTARGRVRSTTFHEQGQQNPCAAIAHVRKGCMSLDRRLLEAHPMVRQRVLPILTVFAVVTWACFGCARVPPEQVRSDLERLVAAGVNVTRLEKLTEKSLGEFGGRGDCYSGGALVTFVADVRARVLLRNFRTDPEFDAVIGQLEAGRLRVPPARLEQYGAMFRLAQMTPPNWKELPVGRSLSITPTFEYLQKCGRKELRFERALPGHKKE